MLIFDINLDKEKIRSLNSFRGRQAIKMQMSVISSSVDAVEIPRYNLKPVELYNQLLLQP